MKKIFEYTDYREWLRDAFEDFKQRKTVISWRYMAMKMGADPGNLLRVSQGKIHLPLSLIKPAAEFFELEGKEADVKKPIIGLKWCISAAPRLTPTLCNTMNACRP